MGTSGNILDVKAYKVGRDFVTVMLVEADPADERRIAKDLKQLSDAGLKVSVQPTQPWHGEDDAMRCKDGVKYTGHLRANGLDKQGLIKEITKLLADEGLDIVSFSCNQHYQ